MFTNNTVISNSNGTVVLILFDPIRLFTKATFNTDWLWYCMYQIYRTKKYHKNSCLNVMLSLIKKQKMQGICFLTHIVFKEHCSDIYNVRQLCMVYWSWIHIDKSEPHLRKILICPIYLLANPGYWKTEYNCFCCHEWEQLKKKPTRYNFIGDFLFKLPMLIIYILTQFL